MRTDNNEHKALFTIPTAAYSSALANIKPLPEQRRITGHKQTDAYLWVLEVIRLNEPAHLDAAEAALVKIKISPKEAQERYSRYLLANGYEPFQVAFGIIGMDNPAQVIRNARESARRCGSRAGHQVFPEIYQRSSLGLDCGREKSRKHWRQPHERN